MTSSKKSMVAYAERLALSPDDRRELLRAAVAYDQRVAKLARAAAEGNAAKADHLTSHLLTAWASKVVAAARGVAKEKTWSGTLEDIKQRAGLLDPFKPVEEPVTVDFEPKGNGKLRPLLKFGWRRRALQRMCSDVLRVRLPRYSFDYMERDAGGMSSAAEALGNLMLGGKYDYIVCIDVADCYPSLNQSAMAAILPLPKAVIENVLLVGEETEVHIAQGANTLLGRYPHLQPTFPDQAARQGLPQGARTSPLVASRAVLGPLLDGAGLSERIIAYGDDAAIAAKTQAEASDILNVLQSRYEKCPVGPLKISRRQIYSVFQPVQFGQYSVKQRPHAFGGGLHFAPSGKSWLRYGDKIAAICVYQDEATIDLNVENYQDQWRKSFPLWEHPDVELNLELGTLQAVQEGMELRKRLMAQNAKSA